MQGTTGGVTLNGSGTGAISYGGARFEMAGNKTLTLGGSSDPVLVNGIGELKEVGGVMGILKTDANTWNLTATNDYTGSTSVNNGVLRIAATQTMTGALNFGSANTITTAGTLDVNENATFGSLLAQTNSAVNTNILDVAAGKTVTINGNVAIGSGAVTSTTLFNTAGTGSFVVNNTVATGNTFLVGGSASNAVTADFSSLTTMNVSLNPTAGTFLVSSTSGTNSTGVAILKLAKDTTITANALTVGGAGSYNGNVGQVNQLQFGSGDTVLNVNNLNVGSGARDLGSLTFLNPTDGTLTVRAADGTSAAAFNMGTGTATTAVALSGNQNTFDVTGHDANLKFSTVSIGTQNRGADLANVFSFDAGTLEIGSLNASSRGANPFTTTTTINLGGGIVTSGAWTLASASGDGSAVATANLTGGNITFSGNISRGADAVGGGSATGMVNLNGANLNMNGSNIGDATNQIVFNAMSGTLRNLGELNGGGTLTKTTAGVLVLDGANTYTGKTVIDAGKLSISNENNLGANPVAPTADQLTLNGGTLLTTADLTLDDSNRGITVSAASSIETSTGTTATISSTILGGANLTKEGDGTLVFTAAQASYSGSVTINGGTLLATNTTGSATGSGAVSVTAPATLGGTGSIVAGSGNNITINGTLDAGMPSASSGSALAFTVDGAGSLALSGTTLFQLFTNDNTGTLNGVTAADRVVVSASDWSNVVFGGSSTLSITTGLTATTFVAGDSWKIFDWVGVAGGSAPVQGTNGFNSVVAPALDVNLGWDYSNLFTTGTIAVIVVPEPSRALFLMLGLLGLMFRRRRARL
jgi:autotransporter-associated beta strand protein